MKQKIRLTESQLHRMIKESVRQALNENGENNLGTVMATASAYMEEFRMGELSEIIYNYEKYSPLQIINILLDARSTAKEYMEMGADDADDFYNAVNTAYFQFSKNHLQKGRSLGESKMHRMIKESVRQVLWENDFNNKCYPHQIDNIENELWYLDNTVSRKFWRDRGYSDYLDAKDAMDRGEIDNQTLWSLVNEVDKDIKNYLNRNRR